MRTLTLGAPLLVGALLFGCTGDDTTSDAGAPPVDAGPADSGATEPVDAGPVDSGVVEVPTVCDELGLRKMPFQDGASTYAFGDVAGDFSVTLLDGSTWTLSEQWTGCESYVFLNYIGGGAARESDEIFGSNLTELVRDTPKNSHIFFISWENSPPLIRERMEQLQLRLWAEAEVHYPDPEERIAQIARFHFVVDRRFDLQGSVGAFLLDYLQFQGDSDNFVDLGERGRAPAPLPHVFGIDRDQRWDSGGSMATAVGRASAFRMASYLPAFYDHKARIRDQLAAETGVETRVLLDEQVTDRIFVREANLPAASEMANFDALEFDVAVNCPHRNVFACSEWDRIARIQLCTDGQKCEARQELVRWITPYWRRGSRRWIMDASTLLSLVDGGGTQYFRIEMGPSWERATARDVRVALRLRARDAEARAAGAEYAFGGGQFNEEYNTRDPFSFTPPPSASKVELVLILSGHGQDGNTNCSEWCDHRHHFTVNGADIPVVRHEGNVGSIGGCGPLAQRGVSPGQYGNWAPERAYWCPGLPVDHIRLDITEQVNLGEANTLTYRGTLGANGAPGGGNVTLSSYVVWYE